MRWPDVYSGLISLYLWSPIKAVILLTDSVASFGTFPISSSNEPQSVSHASKYVVSYPTNLGSKFEISLSWSKESYISHIYNFLSKEKLRDTPMLLPENLLHSLSSWMKSQNECSYILSVYFIRLLLYELLFCFLVKGLLLKHIQTSMYIIIPF